MKKIFVLAVVILSGLVVSTRSMAQTEKSAVPVRTTDPHPMTPRIQATVPLKGGGGGAVPGAATAVTGTQAGRGIPAVGGTPGIGGTSAVGGAPGVSGGKSATGAQTGTARIAPVKQGSGGTTRTTTAVTGGKSTTSGAASKAPIKSAPTSGASGANTQ